VSIADDWRNPNRPRPDGPRATGGLNGHAPPEVPEASPVFKTLAEFCREFEPPSYTIEPFLRSSSLYTLTARTGHGKTALLIAAMFAVATGRPDILGLETTRARVAFLTFENPDDVRMRMAVAAYVLNIDLDELFNTIVVLDRRHTPELILAGMNQLAESGAFQLVIVDTYAAFFDGDDPNCARQSGEFMRRLRPFTKVSGNPTVLVAAHPVKNASEDNLIPYGSGAVLNEVDGNLIMWKSQATGFSTLHWQGKLRGADFEPKVFRFEEASSPDVVDARGRQILLPVMRPCDPESAEKREQAEASTDLALVTAMLADPDGTQAAWGQAIGKAKSRINSKLAKLEKMKLVEHGLGGKWRVTEKGRKEVANA